MTLARAITFNGISDSYRVLFAISLSRTVGGQGWGCSPIKRDRELGSNGCRGKIFHPSRIQRRETVCSISARGVGV